MSTPLTRDFADGLARLGRHWGWILFFGIVMVVVGIIALAWPGPTVIALAVLFGIQLIVSGIFSLISGFASTDVSGGTRVMSAILGLLGILIGLYAVRHILVSVVALALLLGIYWVANGVVGLYNAIAHSDQPHRGWMAFIGVLSLLAGIIVIVWPTLSLVTLAIVLGVWLLIYGVMEIFVAFRVRSAYHHIRDTVAASPA